MFVGIVILVLNVLRSVSADTWHRLDDALYLVDNTSRLNYDEAHAYCLTRGANLTRIDSDKIQSFLTTFISPPLTTERCFWIGCHDREVEGQFKWLDGTQVRYDGWASDQPDDGRGIQDCACLWSSQDPNRHGRWDDNTCGARLDLICQKGVSLPGLTSGPSVEDISSTFVTVSWSSWIPCLDTGEGPVISYLVYLQTMDGEWVEGGGIDLDMGEGDLQRRMEFVLTGLEPGTEYNISVSAVREGVGGEGPKGPLVSVMTIESGRRFGAFGKGNLLWFLFGVSLAGNILLVVVIMITCRRQGKQQKKKTLPNLTRAPSGYDPKDHQYEVPGPLETGMTTSMKVFREQKAA
ncbi:uncharacterized protein LOC100890603 isoform X6 [Strongylocentrotus purpuratus]|uniref:Uncharacterized protein n=1 Tax=Strongylocentrotus purpuratus TaxID=7668 RepID=A0A7M7PJY7_STRPU|nr:uncharacterized protein LOC100890603 isoform X6 [Strongylocentrotus purpuratus]